MYKLLMLDRITKIRTNVSKLFVFYINSLQIETKTPHMFEIVFCVVWVNSDKLQLQLIIYFSDTIC